MPTTSKKPPLPSDDKRWRIVNGTMRRHGFARDALIETLHTVQEYFGYLDKPSLKFVAESLHVPLSQAYGVATFYHYFTLKPPGKHTCLVCLGTACYIKGVPGYRNTGAWYWNFCLRRGITFAPCACPIICANCRTWRKRTV